MRVISSALKAGIASGKIANIIKLTLKDGSVHGYTDFQLPLTVAGVTYNPAPGLQKINMVLTNNAEVSNQEFSAAWLDIPEGGIESGSYDEAMIEVAWFPWENNGTSNEKVVTFTGTLGTISWTEDGFQADVQSQMRNLSVNIGTPVTAACSHQLFDQFGAQTIGACTLNKATYTFTSAVTSIQTAKSKFTATSLTQAANYFTNGVLKFTSGNNSGLSVEIKQHDVGGVLTLFLPTAFQFVVGDTFTIIAGCDKTMATCQTKFNNFVNFGGYPHIKPEASFQ